MVFSSFSNGFEIRTTIPFGRAPVPIGAAVFGQIYLNRRTTPPEEPKRWVATKAFHGETTPWLLIGQTPTGFLLRVIQYADFLVDANGENVECFPQHPLSDPIIEALFFDRILPMVVHLRGLCSLHASAVALPQGRVVALVGKSGAGKSTLAAHLAREFPLVADDCLTVRVVGENIEVYPSYPSIRLFDDSFAAVPIGSGFAPTQTSKKRVDLAPARGPLVLTHLYFVQTAEGGARLEDLAGRHAFMELTEHLHRVDPEEQTLMRHEFETLHSLTRRVRFRRLSHVHDYAQLGNVASLLLEDAR